MNNVFHIIDRISNSQSIIFYVLIVSMMLLIDIVCTVHLPAAIQVPSRYMQTAKPSESRGPMKATDRVSMFTIPKNIKLKLRQYPAV